MAHRRGFASSRVARLLEDKVCACGANFKIAPFNLDQVKNPDWKPLCKVCFQKKKDDDRARRARLRAESDEYHRQQERKYWEQRAAIEAQKKQQIQDTIKVKKDSIRDMIANAVSGKSDKLCDLLYDICEVLDALETAANESSN